MKGIFQIVFYMQLALVFLVPLVLLAESEEKSAREKKAEVVAKLLNDLESKGITPPHWLETYWETVLYMLVDVVIFILIRTGAMERVTASPEKDDGVPF